MDKPGRPLGLSIAIIISLMLYTLLPFAQVIFMLSLRQQFQTIEFLEAGGAIGGDLKGLQDLNLLLPVLNGVIFLVVAVLAWRGGSRLIRPVFVLSVVLITMVTILLTVRAMGIPPSAQAGLDSATAAVDTLLEARIIASVLIALYVIWYANRGPARAFYRGYYLPDPADAQPSPRSTGDTLS
ncbi:MAG: hypothetical protein K8J31_00930 [Anaerolineae bacterium]|jgi:hypothetical protein|nr:hypothetical protein [Anaerolineae bacterium]